MRHLFFILLPLLLPMMSVAQEFPDREDRLVNDFTNTLTEQEIRELTTLLEGHERESSIEIAVVLIATLDGRQVSDFAFELGEHWGIGSGGTGKGALIAVSTDDKRAWLATGFGKGSRLPDGLVNRIIMEQMIPPFTEGAYFTGIEQAAESIVLASDGKYPGQRVFSLKKTLGLVALIAVGLTMLALLYRYIRSRSTSL